MPDDALERAGSALHRATRALARRDHSTESLRAKLERAGASAEEQERALGRLAQAGYLDDERFARDRAEHLAGKGYGDEWIRGDLEKQGVGSEEVEAALASLVAERERAEQQSAPLKTLLRRGFSEESLEALLHSAQQEE